VSAIRVAPGQRLDLAAVDAGNTGGRSKDQLAAATEADLDLIDALQEAAYVAQTHGILIVLQGMDACGKDGTIRHVFRGIDPLGSRAVAFGVPTDLEARHDYLWRIHLHTPARGDFVIFNRSHYESVLVERVLGIVPEATWQRRYGQIVDFEERLAAEHTIILKFFLHISHDEQEQRLLDRMRDPLKQWKVNQGDWDTRARWVEYQTAFEDMLERTSTEAAPWYVIPADRKWYRNYLVARTIADRLQPYRQTWELATRARGERQMAELDPAIRARLRSQD
jgi:PPK2 family polyphosphate:nucleotide phosphotransferase